MRLVPLLCLSFSFASIQALLIGAVPMQLSALNASDLALGAAVGCYALGSAASLLITGLVIDKIGSQRVAYVATACLLGAVVIYAAMSESVVGLAAGRLLHGIGAGAFFCSCFAWIAVEVDAAARGRALGAVGAVQGLAMLIFPGIGVLVQQRFDFSTLLFVAIPLAAFCLALPAYRESRSVLLPETKSLDQTMVGVGSLLIAGFFAAATIGLLEAFAPEISKSQSEDGPLVLYVVFAVAMTLGRGGGGFVGDRVGHWLLLMIALVCSIFSLVCLELAPGKASMVASVGGFGLGIGIALTALLTLASLQEQAGRRSRITGAVAVAVDLGAATGAASLGIIRLASPGSSAPIAAAVMAATAFAAAAMLRRLVQVPNPISLRRLPR